MITIQMLEDADTIEATDYVRQLSLTFNGQSDTLETTSTYGGSRTNRLGWMLAAEVCPAFVGKTVGEFNRGMDFKHRHYIEVSQYEFIRGNVPITHHEPGEPHIFPDLIPIQKKVFNNVTRKRKHV
jgi:hypothetical protein